jgi:hypothetical protein
MLSREAAKCGAFLNSILIRKDNGYNTLINRNSGLLCQN